MEKPPIMEPITSIHREGKYIQIITKLPGIIEEKIRIDLEKTTLTILASNAFIRYKKVIVLPWEVFFCKKDFSDGELHLTVEKTSPPTLCTPYG